jgi:ABC-type branched-subunit amino acid transport system ATPase component
VSAPALEARGLIRHFGALIATDDVSFALQPDARQALIGPNGAGKTTLINILPGILKRPPQASLLRGATSRIRAKRTGQDGAIAHLPDQSALS